MKYYKYIIIAFFATVVIGTPWLITTQPTATRFIDNIFSYVGNNYTAVFLRQGITAEQLKDKYSARAKTKKIRIMLVPGHEPGFGGTEFQNIKERELVVDLARYIQLFLMSNPHYEVVVSRDHEMWNPILEKYFTENWSGIINFLSQSREEMFTLVNNGTIQKFSNGVYHNDAPTDVALRLYGINKWSNENNIDIAIHIHLNDYPRKNRSTEGKYSGLAIYVPERQYSNSSTTKEIADSIYERLSRYNATSDFPLESGGIVEEQELIAIGSYNTLDVPSMLIEYGYIYEPQFRDLGVRDTVLRDLAFQTYLGLEDFFDEDNSKALAYDTLMLPYIWSKNLDEESQETGEIFALQTALMFDGVYPPGEKTKNDCPRTGKIGPCTLTALSDFQKKFGITDEKNFVGEKTKEALNKLYSVQLK